ncbi:tetratricopeptide repeat protein [Dolichospermum sp. UHCC 0684]|uniref:Tetratricopeptide repeat protein n=2 Tax=Aphanizomenonaceae TaxID=1892259 RepID=A0A6H2BZC0_DOLFA|nr:MULTISPECIES: tetratricopeptide repeat protein [Aphanizomenonaceae]MBD2277692.1 tetratricopeptide repeat protein [Aphanizomenon flos-aquae FACHB-1040]MEA5530353.1 tetratricopeptide repeat protein [Dolichospermum sp. UHCC 0684]MTJ34695.1 tetratricopeptide repeat protein [Dolichospermum sp. UHCC 0260]QJB44306.1 tetratricopeptide repeat protein [Dolichospermum flos-aquae CCAP 1403/13F]
MATSGDDYLVQRGKQIERKKRIVTYIGMVSFGGSMLFGGVNTIKQAWEKPKQAVVQSAETELQKQIKGYELVLQREPNNQTALEKLSMIRLRMGDNKSAIALMERLVKLHPDRQDYQTVLANTKKTIGK